MVFVRMDNVETLKEQFDGDVYFRARWREPKLDNLKVQQKQFFYFTEWFQNFLIEVIFFFVK